MNRGERKLREAAEQAHLLLTHANDIARHRRDVAIAAAWSDFDVATRIAFAQYRERTGEFEDYIEKALKL